MNFSFEQLFVIINLLDNVISEFSRKWPRVHVQHKTIVFKFKIFTFAKIIFGPYQDLLECI